MGIEPRTGKLLTAPAVRRSVHIRLPFTTYFSDDRCSTTEPSQLVMTYTPMNHTRREIQCLFVHMSGVVCLQQCIHNLSPEYHITVYVTPSLGTLYWHQIDGQACKPLQTPDSRPNIFVQAQWEFRTTATVLLQISVTTGVRTFELGTPSRGAIAPTIRPRHWCSEKEDM